MKYQNNVANPAACVSNGSRAVMDCHFCSIANNQRGVIGRSDYETFP